METAPELTVDVARLLFSARDRVDFYWNFYVGIVLAVIGWLLSLKATLSLRKKILVSVTFLIASVLNLMGLYGSYTLAEALRTDLLEMTATASPLPDTRLILEQHSYLTQRLTAVLVHAAIALSILAIVWFGRFSEKTKS